jgi:hypothetical protein
MSRTTKEQIKEAVYDMTVLTDDGLHPSSALEKIASDNSFTDDQLRIIAKTYNTAAAADQRKKCSSVLDWLETYPIADVESVLERRTKKAAVAQPIKTASVWDTKLDRQKQYQPAPPKLACLQVKEPEPKQPAPVKVDRFKLARQIEEEEVKLAYLKPQFDSMASVLRKHVKAMPDYRQEAVKYAAVHQYGTGITDYFDTVFNKTTISVPKVASVVSLNDPIVKSLGELKKCAEAIVGHVTNISRLAHSIKSATVKKKAKADDMKMQDILNPSKFWVDTASRVNNMLHDKSTSAGRYYDELTHPQETSLSSSLLGPHTISFGLETPSEKQKLKKIELQSLLNDLRHNDMIISEYDDDKIANAFNEIFSVAPTIAEKPAMLRAMMREYLAKDGLGMYDLHSILADEKAMIEADARRRSAVLQEQQSAYNAAQDSYELTHPRKERGTTVNVENRMPAFPKSVINIENNMQGRNRPKPKTP